jgi:hypothetical protein
MHDFPEEGIPGQIAPGQPTPGRITPEQLRQFTLDLGIELTDVEAGKFTAIIEAIQGAEGGGSIGYTGLTSPTMDVPTGGPSLGEIDVREGGADRDRMMQQLIRRPGYQGLGY